MYLRTRIVMFVKKIVCFSKISIISEFFGKIPGGLTRRGRLVTVVEVWVRPVQCIARGMRSIFSPTGGDKTISRVVEYIYGDNVYDASTTAASSRYQRRQHLPHTYGGNIYDSSTGAVSTMYLRRQHLQRTYAYDIYNESTAAASAMSLTRVAWSGPPA